MNCDLVTADLLPPKKIREDLFCCYLSSLKSPSSLPQHKTINAPPLSCMLYSYLDKIKAHLQS